MSAQIKTLPLMQEYVWDRLPMRKYMAGREPVFDAVVVVIQEWPDEILVHTKSGDTGEVVAIKELTKSVKRHLTLTYGEKKFGSVWIIALQILLPLIIDLILKWWRRRKEHQGWLRLWRRKWVSDGA